MSKIFLCSLFLTISTASFAQDTLNWKFYHPLKKEWMAFGSIGSIQQKLILLGELPPPFKEKNDEQFRWIENHRWKLVSEINVNENFYYSDPILVFENIDTYADIFINGEKIYSAANYFIPHTISLKGLLKKGANTIEVVLTPPKLYHKAIFETESFHYPAPNDTDSIYVSSRTRKPQFHFGWDWTARINTIGIDKPAIFYSAGPNLCRNVSIVTTSITKQTANISVHIDLDSSFTGFISSQIIPKSRVDQTENILTIPLTVKDPKFWQPLGLGEPNLYFDTLVLYDNDNIFIDKYPFYFGIRHVELVQTVDSMGTSFSLNVNSNPIFCLGMNIIPPSVFLSELTKIAYDTLIHQIVESKANMVRVWGGGTYFDDYFYEQCARNGIMVWQDFMFACAMYPGDTDFLKNVSSEVNHQVLRLAKHPSIVLFNGNNEVDVAWKNWGLQEQYKLNNAAQQIIDSAYTKLFKEIIPKAVKKITPLPYTHTSPLSNWGKPERYNHGTQHYWGVWHGNDALTDFSKNIGRFNAEYGFQSFPELPTMAYITSQSNWQFSNTIIKHHQKSYIGNGKIEYHANKYFTKPKCFSEFIYQSQLIQKHAMKTAILAHRLDAPRCMGSLFWQFNDCYPGPTWSSIDYLGNPKALYYTLPHLFQVQTICVNNNKLWFLTSVLSTGNKEVKVLFFDKYGHQIGNGTAIINPTQWKSEIPLVIPRKTHAVEIELEKTLYLEVLTSSKKISSKGNIVIEKIEYTAKTSSGKLFFVVKKAVVDVWFYDDSGKVTFSKNYTSYLPGRYILNFTSDSKPNNILYYCH